MDGWEPLGKDYGKKLCVGPPTIKIKNFLCVKQLTNSYKIFAKALIFMIHKTKSYAKKRILLSKLQH